MVRVSLVIPTVERPEALYNLLRHLEHQTRPPDGHGRMTPSACPRPAGMLECRPAGAFGAPEESLLCEAVYEGMPYASLAHALFVRARTSAVLPVPHVTTWREGAAPAQRLAS